MTVKIILVAVLLGVLAGLALFLGAVRSEATPCPSSDPTQCPVYGDSRDAWLAGKSFGLGEGDSFQWSTSSTGVPFTREIACSNAHDDDIDGKTDYSGHGLRDPGCTSLQDDDESDGPPDPPPPPVPPPPPGGPPPPPEQPRERTDTFTVGNANTPNPLSCTSITAIGKDLPRLPLKALYVQNSVWCDIPAASINIAICAQKRLAWLPDSLFYPVVCDGAWTIANLRLSARIQRRCRTTQTPFQWQAEAIVRVTAPSGAVLTGYFPTGPDWPSPAGWLCR